MNVTPFPASDPQNWRESYEASLSEFETCTAKLELLIRDLLTQEGLEVVQIESRTKDPDSLSRKVANKKEGYKDPLSDVTDLIGIRVITYYAEDVARVGEIVQEQFTVDLENSVDKHEALAPDRFGYSSVHYVVSLDEARATLPEWSILRGKKSEIQVRTATQHAWAAIDHKLSYRTAREVPRRLQRRLFQLSALFELADDQFSVLRDELAEVEAGYSDDVRVGNLGIPIDNSSLDAYLKRTRVVSALAKTAMEMGIDFTDPEDDSWGEELEQDRRDLVSLLDDLGLATIADVDEALKDDAAKRSFRENYLPAYESAGITMRTPEDLLAQFLLYRAQAGEQVVRSVYAQSVWGVFQRVYGTV